MSRKAWAAGAVCVVASLIALVRAPSARAFVPPSARGRAQLSGDMVFVPAASFHFGAEAKWGGPVPGQLHNGPSPAGIDTKLASFYIDRTEVTAAQYHSCVQAGVCAALTQGDTSDVKQTALCTYGQPGREHHPVNCVAWDEAKKFCAWMSKRLPTDAEFELAQRGTSERPFPWGDVLPTPKHLNACDASCVKEGLAKIGANYTSLWADTNGDDGWGFTAPVGSYPDGASPYGALDMSGNVEEWVSDVWTDLGAPGGGGSSPTPDVFVVRGGAWDLNSVDAFAVTRRISAGATTRTAWLGFRCARDAS